MSDILIGINEVAANKIMDFLYGKAEFSDKLFKGELEFEGVKASWQIDEAPKIIFAPPAGGGGSFSVHLGKFTVSISGAGFTIALDASGMAEITEGKKFLLKVTDIKPDTSKLSPGDAVICKFFIDAVKSAVIKNINTMLLGISMPDINIGGVSFGNLSVTIDSNVAGIYGALPGRSADPVPLPDKEVFVAFSREAMAEIANKFLPQFRGREEKSSGSQNFFIGSTSYKCSITVNNIYAYVSQSPMSISGCINLIPGASANLTVLLCR